MLDAMARYTIPLFLLLIPLYGLIKGVDVLGSFIKGAMEALEMCLRIVPYIVAIFVAIGLFRASGALDILASILSPLLRAAGIPAEVLPLAIIRPLSGNGSLALLTEILSKWGPDSFIGRLASVMQGSTDTTFYILSLYFGSVGILKPRHAVAAGLAADLTGFVAAAFIVRLLFGSPANP